MKIVFSDIDGTFQDLGVEVPAINLEAVRAMQDSDNRFVFVTGRGYHLVQKMLAELNLECDIIFGNGVGLKELDGPLIYKNCLSLTETKRIVQKIEDEQQLYFIHTDQEVIIKPLNHYQEQIKKLRESLASMGEQGSFLMNFKEEFFENDCLHAEDPIDFLEAHPERHIVKIELMVADDQEHDYLKEVISSEEAYVFHSFYKTLEIVHPLGTKGNAIVEYLERYQSAETFAIGDGENDLPMLEVADVSVAVANASEKIKAKCRFVADSCNEGGVGKFIFEHVLGGRVNIEAN